MSKLRQYRKQMDDLLEQLREVDDEIQKNASQKLFSKMARLADQYIKVKQSYDRKRLRINCVTNFFILIASTIAAVGDVVCLFSNNDVGVKCFSLSLWVIMTLNLISVYERREIKAQMLCSEACYKNLCLRIKNHILQMPLEENKQTGKNNE